MPQSNLKSSLIEVEELEQQIQGHDPDLVMVAVMPRWRHWLARLPGCHQVWRRRLSPPGSHHLIDAEGFQRWARSLGIHNHSRVVLLDERYDAIRLWWAFHHYGKTDVRVLNGGLQAWRQAGLPILSGPPAADRWWGDEPGRGAAALQGTFTAHKGKAFPIATNDDIWRAQNDDAVQLWDSRDPAEWSGRQRLRGARRAGRIPWSLHLCWREFRCGDGNGTAFRPDHELEAIVERHGIDPGKQQMVYCQSGVRSTTVLFALARLGWDQTRLFNHDGSWRDWCREPGNPVLREVGGRIRGENAPDGADRSMSAHPSP